MARKIAVLVGSLREASFNRKAVEALRKVTPGEFEFVDIDISDIPSFNQDLEDTPPAQWVRLRNAIRGADAVLFATPEYNRSVPGVLKNAIDVASRPYGQNVFDGKPAAVLSVSVGQIGGFGANHHLRQVLAYLNMPTMAQPEAYLGPAGELFDDKGELKQDSTRKFLTKFGEAFAKWIETQHSGAEYAVAAE